MPSGAVQVKVEDTEVVRALQQIMFITSPPMLAEWAGIYLGTYFDVTTERRFAAQGWSGGDWEPLAPATQAIRASLGLGPDFPINVRFGNLRSWLEEDNGVIEPNAFGADFTWPGFAPSSELEDEFATAQVGKGDPRTPARPVVEMTADDAVAIYELFAAYINRSFGGATATGIIV